jgi:DNA-binding transcriptional LysR family regulator
MNRFRLHDWNDVRLLLACADHGGFAGAAAALGIDQTTVSRRISALEAAAGRPLFSRRRSGAAPTIAGLALLERARAARAAMAEFEGALAGIESLPPAQITLAASEGLLTYTLIPLLLGRQTTGQPVALEAMRHPPPSLSFTTASARADISLMLSSAGELPVVAGAMKVRRVGTIHFRPVASRQLIRDLGGAIDSFDTFVRLPLVDMDAYRMIGSLGEWNALVTERRDGEEMVVTTPSTPIMHKALLDGQGVGILPSYSGLYDERVVVLDFPAPTLDISLWLVAHEDSLREPSIRDLYDDLAKMFLESPWFRDNAQRSLSG